MASQGLALQRTTITILSPIPALSFTLFREKFWDMCSARGIKRGVMPYSIRIGGSRTAKAHGVTEEAREAHGRWKSDSMVQLFIRRNEDSALEVTPSLGLA